MAVVNPHSPGEFILDIECDGATYHSSRTARDRDRLRQQVLESLGWNIYRIWSTDWFKNPKAELNKLLEAIKSAEGGSYKKKVSNKLNTIKINYNNIVETQESKITPYIMANASDTICTKGNLQDLCKIMNDINPWHIAKVLRDVVYVESPIHKDELYKRVASLIGFKSTGSRIIRKLEEVEELPIEDQKIYKKRDFYYSSKQKRIQIRNRASLSNNQKKIEYVPQEEISLAAELILKKEFSIPLYDLCSQISSLLGYARMTENIQESIESIIQNHIDNNDYIVSNDRISFNSKKADTNKHKKVAALEKQLSLV